MRRLLIVVLLAVLTLVEAVSAAAPATGSWFSHSGGRDYWAGADGLGRQSSVRVEPVSLGKFSARIVGDPTRLNGKKFSISGQVHICSGRHEEGQNCLQANPSSIGSTQIDLSSNPQDLLVGLPGVRCGWAQFDSQSLAEKWGHWGPECEPSTETATPTVTTTPTPTKVPPQTEVAKLRETATASATATVAVATEVVEAKTSTSTATVVPPTETRTVTIPSTATSTVVIQSPTWTATAKSSPTATPTVPATITTRPFAETPVAFRGCTLVCLWPEELVRLTATPAPPSPSTAIASSCPEPKVETLYQYQTGNLTVTSRESVRLGGDKPSGLDLPVVLMENTPGSYSDYPAWYWLIALVIAFCLGNFTNATFRGRP